MKTIIIDQPQASLITSGIEKDTPTVFSEIFRYLDYIGNEVDFVLITSSETLPPFDSLPTYLKEEYTSYKDIKGLPDYDKLPLGRFVGIAKIEKGRIADIVALQTTQKLPTTVKPHNTLFDFDPKSNQVIFQALDEFVNKEKDEALALQANLQKKIQEKKKLQEELKKKEKEIEQLSISEKVNNTLLDSKTREIKTPISTSSNTILLEEDEPIQEPKPINKIRNKDINIGGIIGVIVAIAVIVLLIIIGGGNIIMGIGLVGFMFVLIVGYFR